MNRWQLALQSIKSFIQGNNPVFGKSRPSIRKLKIITILSNTFINRRGYGNFKKRQHPINPDGYAILLTCQFSVFSAFSG